MFFVIFGDSSFADAQKRRDTPDFWMCSNRSKINSYEFARARYVCDLHHFIDPDYVESEFSQFIFDEQADIEVERRRVMTEIYALIRDTAEYFINERDPDVTQEEIDWFVLSSFSIGNQETFWSHYRLEENMPTQYMRGDYGHGHGIFQVDDRYHFSAVTDGRATNIVYNMIYSLEEYYEAWERAKSVECVDSPTSFLQISRSAYSAYNGGPKKICRWINPEDRWAQNDRGFLEKITKLKWESYVDDFSSPASVDIKCIAEGREGCQTSEIPEDDVAQQGVLYVHSDGPLCLFTEEGLFKCVEQAKDSSCLVNTYEEDFSNFNGRTSRLTKAMQRYYDFDLVDRHAICKSSFKNLVYIGSNIKLKKNINLRKTPGGSLLVTIPKESVLQVLDFEFKNYSKEDRYYHVKYKGLEGYFYAGDVGSNTSWASVTSKAALTKIIAKKGDYIKAQKVVRGVLVNEQEIINIQKDDVIEVDSVIISGINNSISYDVLVSGKAIRVFAGHTSPQSSVEDYFSISSEKFEDIAQLAKLKDNTWWKRVRSCASSRCRYTGKIRGPKMSNKSFEIIDSSSSFYKIKQGSLSGWLRKKFIVLL